MESIHYYHDYQEYCYNTIEKLSKDLHNTYVRRNNLANICYANLNLLESNKITKELLDNMILGKKVKGVKLLRKLDWSNEAKAVSLRITYNRFAYLCTVRIPKLLAIIRYYDWMCRIPHSIFNQTQRSLNKSLIETLIRGGSVSLGTYLGTYQVQRAVARESVDWAASFRLRDEMIAAGIEVQSFLNPYGKNWKVKSDNPYYWFCKWIRHRMGVDVVPNQIFYKYHPTHCHININTDSKITKYKTIEEVIKADNLAFDAKLKYIRQHDPTIMDRYPHAKSKRERTKNNEVDEYIRPKSD
jgi:hypothetical protein|nr:MAG TPA: hypothetical protein [Crassvirales sp.]